MSNLNRTCELVEKMMAADTEAATQATVRAATQPLEHRIRLLGADLARLKAAAKVVVDAFENAEDLDSAIDWLGALVERESE